MIKTLEEIGIDALHTTFNNMYDTGKFCLISIFIFITLPKKPGTKECYKHHTICLTSYIIRVIMNRIRNKLHPEIDDCQYGLIPDKGTRVKHNEMICTPDQIGINDKDVTIIQNLYYNQTTAVGIN